MFIWKEGLCGINSRLGVVRVNNIDSSDSSVYLVMQIFDNKERCIGIYSNVNDAEGVVSSLNDSKYEKTINFMVKRKCNNSYQY